MKRLAIGAAVFAAYLAAAMAPLEWFWFDPGVPVFAETAVGGDPQLTYVRTIKTQVLMSYSVTLRDGASRDIVCDAAGGPFEYLPERSGALIGRTLSTFAPSDPRCKSLPVGTYYGAVTWTAPYPLRPFLPSFLAGPLGWIIPPKSVTREILPFHITPKVEP